MARILKSDIPILTFHALDQGTDPTGFPPASFERAIKKWHAGGWHTISLLEAVEQLRHRAPFHPKSFVVTFDDGYDSVYQKAFHVLQECRMTATIFVSPNADGRTSGETSLPRLHHRPSLRWNEIREMHAHGIQFGAHTLTHPDLTKLDEKEIDRELRVSQQALSDALGESVPLFAYPFGIQNARVREVTARYYAAACSDRLGIANPNSDLFALERVETFYLRPTWAADGFTQGWFSTYLNARNIPRRFKRWLPK
jgi:peptidoglycan/xylan/chitin deacetylase (PgdA/CDA1 family)